MLIKSFVLQLFVIALTTAKVANGQETVVILQAPASIMVPPLLIAVFECRAYCAEPCHFNWNINGSSTSHPHQITSFMHKGFSFSRTTPPTGIGNYTLRLSVNASALVNNTKIHCNAYYRGTVIFSDKSNNATLLVTPELLVNPNPLVVSQPRSFMLKWSPPYLWPNQRIKYYTVSISTKDNRTTYDFINATFSDLIVIHEEIPADQDCSEYKFEISAVNNINEMLQKFTITGAFQIGSEYFGTPSVDTTTYFSSNLIPVVRVTIKPPPRICPNQKVNYTLVIKPLTHSSNGSDSMSIEFGPYLHINNESMKHDITSKQLKVNEEYSMQLVLITNFDTVPSVNHTFDTYFQVSVLDTKSCAGSKSSEIYQYKTAAYICGSFILLILILISTIFLSICTQYNWRQYRRTKASTKRAQDAMVHNPIYSGPVYESVRPELRTLSVERSSSTSSSNPNCHSPSPNNNTSALQEKGNCYVDPPSRPQALAVVAVQTCNQQRSNSFVYSGQSHPTSQSVSDENNRLRSQSVSVTTSGRKGKERNKFHLTLSLGQDGNDSMSKKDVVSCVNPISIREVDENYAIMSPAGTVGGLLSLSPEDTEKYKE